VSTYKQYEDDDLTKAIEALEQGHTALWAARRYGVPKSTLQRKYQVFKQEQNNEKDDG
jgi:hypothetical protein